MSSATVRTTMTKALRGWKTACHRNHFTSVPLNGGRAPTKKAHMGEFHPTRHPMQDRPQRKITLLAEGNLPQQHHVERKNNPDGGPSGNSRPKRAGELIHYSSATRQNE